MWLRKKYLYFLLVPLLFFTHLTPASAHNDLMAGTKWFFGSNGLVAVMEFYPALLTKLKDVGDAKPAIASCSEEQLARLEDQVITPYLNSKMKVSVNDKVFPLKVVRIDRSNPDNWKMWLTAREVRFDRDINPVRIEYRPFSDETDKTHVNFSYLYRNDIDPLKPGQAEDSVPLAKNIFDSNNQSWDFSVKGAAASQAVADHPLLATVMQFIPLGITHILTGYDHIAFLLALIVIGLSFKEVIKIITAFTIAHSITLLLAALQVVNVNSRFVEIVIALSICYVAIENLFRKEVQYRWLLTFGFGLIHGFGFASVLQELIKEKAGLLPSVLSFNVGVELGQVMIFLVMFPILHLLNKRFELRRVCAGASIAIFVTGFGWLIERVFDLKFLPF